MSRGKYETPSVEWTYRQDEFSTTTTGVPWSVSKPRMVAGHFYRIEGTFQGVLFDVDGIDLVNDSPVEAVMREVLGLSEGDELASVAIRHADGTITVRPWDA